MSDFLKCFINDNCIFRTPPGYYIEGAYEGQYNTRQFFLRNAIFNPRAMNDIAEFYLSRHDDKYQYGAIDTAGSSMLSAIQSLAHSRGIDIRGFSIRKQKKSYGLFNTTEGFLNPDKDVIVIDDLANSRDSIMKARNVVLSYRMTYAGARTIIDLSDKNQVTVDSLYKINDFQLTWEDYYRDQPQGYKQVDVNEFVQRYKHLLYTKNEAGTFMKCQLPITTQEYKK
jgi:orotate phosphoribosyltransferase